MGNGDELGRLARRIAAGDAAAARRAAALLGTFPAKVVWIALRETSHDYERTRGDTDAWTFSGRDEAMRFAANRALKDVAPPGMDRRRSRAVIRDVRAALEAGDWFGAVREAERHLSDRDDESVEWTVHARRVDPEAGDELGWMPEPFARRWCGDIELLIWPHLSWNDATPTCPWLDASTSFSSTSSGLYVGKRLVSVTGYPSCIRWDQRRLRDPSDQVALDETAARVLGDWSGSAWEPSEEDRRYGEWREFDGGSRIEPVIRRRP